ncbi:hypothetical protein V1478_015958 [Vespula squamosa]|uniref:Uncharacterized protein n=1 Tax=Vespula squamosa TaxID=30214 RepID=A0ABD2A2E5_VESSQ
MFDIPCQKRFKFTFKNAPCCIVIDGTGVALIDKKSTSTYGARIERAADPRKSCTGVLLALALAVCDELVRVIPGSRRAAGGQRVAERSG